MTARQDAVQPRLAGERDVEKVLSVLNEAAGWLHERKIRQWPPCFDAGRVLPDLAAGHTWLAELDHQPVGTLVLTWSDPLWESDERAGYVHRLASRRSARGLGARLLAWAGQQTHRKSRDRLRLDCAATNQRLRAYYEQAGFSHRGDVKVDLGDAGLIKLSRYELELRLGRGRGG